ncbi:hypothetical protein TNCV_2051161 [Trichonephila clavipes]|nr:hypothetical protein TNCV_2051161 [Trichonephila clavipes]
MSNKILQPDSDVWIPEIVLHLTLKIGVITRLKRNSPFCQMVSFNLTFGAVEPHHLSQCLDPADDLDVVFFHPELLAHVVGIPPGSHPGP